MNLESNVSVRGDLSDDGSKASASKRVSSGVVNKGWRWAAAILLIIAGTGIPDIRKLRRERYEMLVFNIIDHLTFSLSVFDNVMMGKISIGLLLAAVLICVISVYIHLKPEHMSWNSPLKLTVVLPSILYGKFTGHFFSELTSNDNLASYIPGLCTSIIGFVIWVWTVTAINYNRSDDKYRNRASAKKKSVDSFAMICPAVYPCFYSIVNSLCSSGISKLLFVVFVGIVSLTAVWNQVQYSHDQFCSKQIFIIVASFISSLSVFLNLIIVVLLDVAAYFAIEFLYNRYTPVSNMCIETDDFPESAADASESGFSYPLLSIKAQDIAIASLLLAGLVLMVIADARVAAGTTDPLPDLVHEKFQTAGAIRKSHYFQSFRFSRIVSFIFAGILLGSTVIVRDATNVRKFIFLYSIMLFVRSLFFVFTNLPPPCAGLAHCPCDNPNEKRSLLVSAIHVFGMGIVLDYHGCCDRIISCYTIFMWLVFRTVVDVIEAKVKPPFAALSKGTLGCITVMSMIFIIITRNQYTIDVWFGWLLAELFWILYSNLQKLARYPSRRRDDKLVKIVRWLEQRDTPLVTKKFML